MLRTVEANWERKKSQSGQSRGVRWKSSLRLTIILINQALTIIAVKT